MDDASDKTMHFSSASSGDRDSVDELSSTLSGQLKITSENHSIDDDGDDDDEEDEYFSEEDLLAQMGYAKAEEEGEEEDNEPPKDKPITTPIAELNLVSALKGSRDKDEGRQRAEECRVSWAPDVYNPPCTSDDHFTGGRSDGHRGGSGGGGREIEGSRHGGKGSSKGNVGGSKGGRGSKEKRKAEKKQKHKKRGDY